MLPKETRQGGHLKCGSYRKCAHCLEIREFVLPGTNNKLKTITICASKGVVYVWICKYFKLDIGYTSRMLRVRITEHKSKLKNCSLDAPLVAHFNQWATQIMISIFFAIYKICPQEYNRVDTVRLLVQKKSYWIHSLNTTEPRGLNQNLDFSAFL